MATAAKKLADLSDAGTRLLLHKTQIMEIWEQRVRNSLPAAQKEDPKALKDGLPVFLDALARAMIRNQVGNTAYEYLELSREHARQRAQSTAYTINQVLWEYHILRRTIVEIIDGNTEDLQIIHDFLDRAIAEAGSEFYQLEISRQQAALIDARSQASAFQEAARARDQFLSIASHELKTPITSLKLMLQMTRRRLNPKLGTAPDTQKLTAVLDNCVYQVERVSTLIEDLLDVSRIQAGKLTLALEPVELSTLTAEIIGRFTDELKASNSEVVLNIERDVIAQVDRFRIEQAIVNLLTNAMKYAPGVPLHISVKKDKQLAKIVFKDFGVGIEKERQEKIFERFERANTSRNISGLGLGLFIAKQIVEAHQGKIRLESKIGSGSTFTIELPLCPAK